MTKYERLLLRLMEENKLKENDVVDLNFGCYCFNHNTDPTIRHNIACTLTTKCNLVVVLKDE